MNDQWEQLKYRISWRLCTIVSMLIYYSGVFSVYCFLRKKIFRDYRNIVLTYHRINDGSIDPDISVSTKNFEAQMKYLKKQFDVISLEELLSSSLKKSAASCDRIAITFDDGYKDNFTHAYPVLKKVKLPATIFLVSKFAGEKKEFLGLSEIDSMKRKGIRFESHTATHKILSQLDHQAASSEVLGSKNELEKMLNQNVKFIAYPKGKANHFNAEVKKIVEDSGYKAAFTTENGKIGADSDPFALARIGVRNCPLFVFKLRVSGLFESSVIYLLRKIFKLT